MADSGSALTLNSHHSTDNFESIPSFSRSTLEMIKRRQSSKLEDARYNLGKNVKIAKLYRGEFGQRASGWVDPNNVKHVSKKSVKKKQIDLTSGPRGPSLEQKIIRGDYNAIMRHTDYERITGNIQFIDG